ncbi:unnamed protein product [Pleuronectes platessa]|uniref:Uncharacterized protein n=1 Tax=Pleuronectes platessa TaxID=8262 RepID=A0A9N7VA31_PLEPL|nr:unnamed protein product [Pleuronectes platessa]
MKGPRMLGPIQTNYSTVSEKQRLLVFHDHCSGEAEQLQKKFLAGGLEWNLQGTTTPASSTNLALLSLAMGGGIISGTVRWKTVQTPEAANTSHKLCGGGVVAQDREGDQSPPDLHNDASALCEPWVNMSLPAPRAACHSQ